MGLLASARLASVDPVVWAVCAIGIVCVAALVGLAFAVRQTRLNWYRLLYIIPFSGKKRSRSLDPGKCPGTSRAFWSWRWRTRSTSAWGR